MDEYYCKYKDIRKGLGFIMVTYRKRLTSSFRAITISLTRRYEKLNRAIESGDLTELFTDLVARDGTPMDELMEAMDEQEEEEAETLWAGISELDKNRQLSDQMRELIVQERAYLSSFIDDLERLPGDSKFDEFRTELDSLLQRGERQVIVFSQFKDTIDYLKDSFTVSLGDRIGSYTGEGGHYWKGGKWFSCSKQDLQNKFSDSDDPLSILFCTDAASESLNLQTCSVMFNYDIPWNPMRIEQRIGRIDRIGQKAPTVKIFTYSYKGTVEDTAFDRCLERIGYFRSTLGYVQPILELNKKIIMTSMERTDEKVEDILDRYYNGVAEIEEETRIQHLVNQYQPEYERMLDKVPVPQAMVEQYLSPLLDGYGWTRENGTYVKEGTRITFDPGYRDRYDDTIRIVTARNASLNLLFGQLPEKPSPLEKDGIECFKLTADGYTGFAVRSGGGFKLAQRISDLSGECPGRLFISPEEVEHHLQRMIHEKHVQGLKNWQSIWKNRYESWKTRVSMYLERIYEWFSKRETADGSVEAYDQDQLIGKWNAYLNHPERKLTQSLAREITFEPDTDRDPKPKTRRRRRASPKNTYEEETLWGEYEQITQEWRKVLRQLRDMEGTHAGN